jgi:hypothetical protein
VQIRAIGTAFWNSSVSGWFRLTVSFEVTMLDILTDDTPKVGLGDEWIAIHDEVARVAQEAIDGSVCSSARRLTTSNEAG